MKTLMTLAMLLLGSTLQAEDFSRSLFYSSIHAGNVYTTEWALKQGHPGATSESHTWLGMDKQWNRVAVHSGVAIGQILLDKELSKPNHPKWHRWALRITSLAAAGGAMYLDTKAGKLAQQK